MQRTTRLKRPQVPEPGALIDFDDIVGRPKYAGEEMTSETDIPSVTAEAEARQAADQEIWTEIETIEASSDVVDVVATYAELQQYDTSTLHDKDLIKVLQDETHQNAITYYRYSTSSETFSYVGAEGPYYTASETDTLLAAKQDTLIAGTNVQIAADGKTISATDTTYDDFVGATALSNGEQGLVPAPLSTDADKFLQGDGSWGTPANTTYTAGTNVQISANNEISATDTTYSPFVGASSSVVGAAGLVPQPAIGDQNKYLKGDGTWATVQSGSGALTIELSADPGDPNTSTFNIVTDGVDWMTISDAFSSGQPVMFFYETPGAFNRLFKQYQLLKVYMDSDTSGNYRFFVIAGEDGTISTIKGDEPSVHPPVPGTVISGTVTHLTPMTSLPVASTTTLGGVKVGNLLRISNGSINAREMIGATTYAGTSGYVPQPQAGDRNKFLKGDGTWGDPRIVLWMQYDPFTDTGPVHIFPDSDVTGQYLTWDEVYELQEKCIGEHRDIWIYRADSSERTYQVVVNEAGGDMTLVEVSQNTNPSTAAIYRLYPDVDNGSDGDFAFEKHPLQDKLTAGTGITISPSNVISASGAVTNNINSTDWNALWQ